MNKKAIMNAALENADGLQLKAVTRDLSFGSKNKGQSMIDEAANAREFGLRITNSNNKAIFMAIVPGDHGVLGLQIPKGEGETERFEVKTFNTGSKFGSNVAGIFARTGADAILGEDVVYNPGSSIANGVTVEGLDSDISINEVLREMNASPTRITSLVMTSAAFDGSNRSPESTNFDNKIKSIWVQALERTVDKELSLRKFMGDQYHDQRLTVDFQDVNAGGFQMILSNEHFAVLQINAKTSLTISAYVGGVMSAAQKIYRIGSEADVAVRKMRNILAQK